MARKSYQIGNTKRTDKQIFSSVSKPKVYSGSDYGFAKNLTGEGIKISVIDSGTPSHVDISNIYKYTDVSDKPNRHKDHHGHATMVGGIIGANNPKTVVGVAPDSDLMFAKVVNGSGECSYNSLVAAMLWSIVQKSDVILISLGSQTDFSLFHDAIRKAHGHGICIVAAAGDTYGKVDYPAKYPEVLSVGRASRSKKSSSEIKNFERPQLILPSLTSPTTYLNNRYTRSSGSSLLAAYVAGLAALAVQDYRNKGKDVSPAGIYKRLSALSRG